MKTGDTMYSPMMDAWQEFTESDRYAESVGRSVAGGMWDAFDEGWCASRSLILPVMEWMLNGEVGTSSKSLAAEFLGIDYLRCDAPCDPADLGRCLQLIKRVTAIRNCVDTLATKNERWAKAAKVWDEIADSMEEEVGVDWSKGRKAKRTDHLMKAAGL